MNALHLWLPGLAALFFLQSVDPVAELKRARGLVEAGDLPGAAQVLEKAVESFPAWGLAHVELAEVLMRAGLAPERQGAALDQARRLEPQNPRAWVLSARWFEAQARPEAAIEACSRALELREDLPDTRLQLGLLLSAAGRDPEAIPLLKRSVEERPEERGARAHLAEACERTGDLACAEAELRALWRQSPANAVFARRLARFFERTGQPDQAAAVLREAGEAPAGRKMRPLPGSRR